MKALYVIGSEAVSLDAPTGRLSAFFLVDHLSALTVPFLIPNIALSTLFIKDDGDADEEEFSVEVLLNNKIIFNNRQVVSFAQANINKNFTNIQGIIVAEFGQMSFKIVHKEIVLAQWQWSLIMRLLCRRQILLQS